MEKVDQNHSRTNSFKQDTMTKILKSESPIKGTTLELDKANMPTFDPDNYIRFILLC